MIGSLTGRAQGSDTSSTLEGELARVEPGRIRANTEPVLSTSEVTQGGDLMIENQIEKKSIRTADNFFLQEMVVI